MTPKQCGRMINSNMEYLRREGLYIKKIRKSVAPSIVPDSVIEAGIPFIKVFAIIMFHTENSIGRINAKILFFNPRYRVINRYHGTNPP